MYAVSPLRYPGGKARFVQFIAAAIRATGHRPSVFLEPFCGGAGVSLSLLKQGHVSSLALNDADALVASFWQVVFERGEATKSDFEWLQKQVASSPVTLDAWRLQKASRPTTLREAAWKCLFLNRTSFNGILHQSGPIGGWGQLKRQLDVRFNREKLADRILALNKLRGQVVRVDNLDWRTFCELYRRHYRSYLYLDPPYYHRAEQLYKHLFDEAQHRALRDYLLQRRAPWLLSYDDATEVRALYGNHQSINAQVVDQTYSTHPMGGASFVGRELLFSNRAFPDAPAKQAAAPHVGLSVVGELETVRVAQQGPTRTRITKQPVPLQLG